MPQGRAVTHADLAPNPASTDLSSKTAAFLMVLTILCGLFCFILCLIAEATRSQVTWSDASQCAYNGSGRTPLMCSAIAFVGLAVSMVVEHLFLLIAVSKSPPSVLATCDFNSPAAKTITFQAGFFFVATWLCFAVAEILLLIGLSVESGHLRNWSRPRPTCLVIKQGLFAAAGVFSLTTVFVAAGLYLTALKAQKMSEEHETLRRQMVETSVLYASPPRSPRLQRVVATPRENPISGDDRSLQSSFVCPSALPLGKHLYFV